jgi:hypothetical protein
MKHRLLSAFQSWGDLGTIFPPQWDGAVTMVVQVVPSHFPVIQNWFLNTPPH